MKSIAGWGRLADRRGPRSRPASGWTPSASWLFARVALSSGAASGSSGFSTIGSSNHALRIQHAAGYIDGRIPVERDVDMLLSLPSGPQMAFQHESAILGGAAHGSDGVLRPGQHHCAVSAQRPNVGRSGDPVSSRWANDRPPGLSDRESDQSAAVAEPGPADDPLRPARIPRCASDLRTSARSPPTRGESFAPRIAPRRSVCCIRWSPGR